MCKACREVPLALPEIHPAAVYTSGVLHSHTCTECGRECACYRNPCAMRGRSTQVGDRRVFLCGVCEEKRREAA
jgi:hypothetical protein